MLQGRHVEIVYSTFFIIPKAKAFKWNLRGKVMVLVNRLSKVTNLVQKLFNVGLPSCFKVGEDCSELFDFLFRYTLVRNVLNTSKGVNRLSFRVNTVLVSCGIQDL